MPLPVLLLASLWAVSPMVVASDHILMRVTCGGTVLTSGEGEPPGFGDHVALSSLHHELSIQVNPPGPCPARPYASSNQSAPAPSA
jgi:hypothetical protein